MLDIFMRYPGGKSKAVTFSYDDGAEQDERLVKIFNQYHLKATFNINSGLIAPIGTIYPKDQIHRRLSEEKIRKLYLGAGHEIALHSLQHKFMDQLDESQMLYEILQDRINLEAMTGRIIRGFAYPYGRYNEKTKEVLKKSGIAYARLASSSKSMNLPQDLLKVRPTCHHNDDMLDQFVDQFVGESPLTEYHDRNPWLLFIWGHSFEFEKDHSWEKIERISEKVSNKSDIWYATNCEIFEYISDFRRLIFSVDGTLVCNPTARQIFFENNSKNYVLEAGETIRLEKKSIAEFVKEEQ